MVVIYNVCFFLTVDDIYADTSFPGYLSGDVLSVACVTHGGRSTGTVIYYIIYLHQLFVGFHQPDQFLFFFSGNNSHGKSIFSQS